MDDFRNVNKRDSKVQTKTKKICQINIINYHLIIDRKKEYDTLIQNVILREVMNLMGITIVDIDIELKMKSSRIEYLESRFLYFCNFFAI